MFQKFLSDTLNKILGNFIYGLNDEQYGLSDLLTGKLELTNIHLKQSVIDLIDIPCRLNFGCIGYFKINLPLFYFMKNPINVYIEDVVIVLSTIPSKYLDDKLYKEKYIENKKNALLSSEYRAIVCSIEGGVIWQMLLSLVNNINISIKNIQIRIEDFTTNPSNCFAFGINIEELFLSLPKEGLPFKRDGYYTKKNELVNNTMINMITVKKLGVYMDSLDMKKIMNKKHYTQWNNLLFNNFNTVDTPHKSNIGSKKERKRKKLNKKLYNKKKKNIKSNQENLNDFQNVINIIKHNYYKNSRNELNINNISKANTLFPKGNDAIFELPHNNNNTQNKQNGDIVNNINNSENNEDNKQNSKYTLPISSFYNFSIFSKSQNKNFPQIDNLSIDNNISWTACIINFADSLEHVKLKDKREELVKRKIDRKRNKYMNNEDVNKKTTRKKLKCDSIEKENNVYMQSNNDFNDHLKFKELQTISDNPEFSYIHKTLSFFSIKSSDSKNYIKNNLKKYSNDGKNDKLSNAHECGGSDGYYTAKEDTNDIEFDNNEKQRLNKYKKGIIKKIQNKYGPCSNEYYDTVDNLKTFRYNIHNSCFYNNGDNIYLNFFSDPENNIRTKNNNKIKFKGSPSYYRRHNSMINNFERNMKLENKKKEKEKIIKQGKFNKYIKKNEIKEKIRKKKKEKINSIYLLHEKAYKINKSKLNAFYLFLRLIKNIKHEYIINPDSFDGHAEIYLSLIPTDHGHLPFSRCFSSWGIQKRSANEYDECLPRLSVFFTLKNIKIIFSDNQMSNIVKWLNYNFITYSTWKTGILSQFEKTEATNEEEISYINNWVLKLLDTHSSKEEKLEAEKYCEEFESTHSINIINLLRNKAFCKLQALKTEVELKKEDPINEMEADKICENGNENETRGQYINEKFNEINNVIKKDDHNKEIKKVANESINFLKNLMKNQKAYNKIKNSFREKVFTIDICLDICIINSTFLLTIETSKIVNTRTVNFVKTYAILMNCIHYHNQISNTHELKNSIDIELYPLTILLITNNLNNKYIKPEVNVLYILTNSEKKNTYDEYRKTFLFDMKNFAFLKKYNILKRKKTDNNIKTINQPDVQYFGNLRKKLKFLVEDNFFFFPKRENNVYYSELDDIILSNPSIYLRYDNQSYTILEKPDHRFFLHNCAYSIFNVNAEIIKSFVDDYFHFLDEKEVLSKKKNLFSFKKKEYFLELGAKYCNNILDNYTKHTNVFLDVQLEKVLSFVITKSGKNSEIQGYSLDLNPLKIVSQLTQRLPKYDEKLGKGSIYDSFFVQFDGIQLKRVLNWDNSAKYYNTYLDNHFIKLYYKIFNSKNNVLLSKNNNSLLNFDFKLNHSNSGGNNKEDASYNETRNTIQSKINNFSHVYDNLYPEDNHNNNMNSRNESEIFNLKADKTDSFDNSSLSEYNLVKNRKNRSTRSLSCPESHNEKVSLLSEGERDKVINSKKIASYDMHNNSCKNKKYKLKFFKNCTSDELDENELIVEDSILYKNHKVISKTINSSYNIDSYIHTGDNSYDNKIYGDSIHRFDTHKKTKNYRNIKLDNKTKNNCNINNNSSNYVLSMSEKTSCIIHLCHIKFNPLYPMFIVKLNEDDLNINICDYDIEFFFLILSNIYEHYNTQELSYKKKKILFLKKKIESLSKLNIKYYNKYFPINNDNNKLLKKKMYSKKKTPRLNALCSTKSEQIKKFKNKSQNEKGDTLDSNVTKSKLEKKNSERKKKKINKRDKKKTNCQNDPMKKGTYVRYLSDTNIRTTKELSVSKLHNEGLIYIDEPSVFSKYKSCNNEKEENGYRNTKEYPNSINVLKENQQKNISPHLNIDSELYKKGFLLQEKDEYYLKHSNYSDSVIFSNKNSNYFNEFPSTKNILRNEFYDQSKIKYNKKNELIKIPEIHSIDMIKNMNTKIIKKKKRRKNEWKKEEKIIYPNYISSDDDSWDDLLENYDSDESLDDNEKNDVQKMLIDIENIKKKIFNNNFIITCSFSFLIKKIVVRLWKRKTPLKVQDKSTILKGSNSYQLNEKYNYLENKSTLMHQNINNSSKSKLDKKDIYNFDNVIGKHDINMINNNEWNKNNFINSHNFITLNDCLQKNMFNNMQHAVPMYTFIFSELCFIARVEKDNSIYVLYSMNNMEIRDETNITLLSMSSIYHGNTKSIEKNASNFGQKKIDKKKKKNNNKTKHIDKNRGINKNITSDNILHDLHQQKCDDTIETEDIFLDYSISNIELPDLRKTHLVLLYFGSLFKNNHTFKFILNRNKIMIFWEVIDECMTWIININDMLPKLHTIDDEIINRLNNSEIKHLESLQRLQKINYDIIYNKENNYISLPCKDYKILICSLINYYNLKFQNSINCEYLYNAYENDIEDILQYTDLDIKQNDFCILTNNNNLKNNSNNKNGVIFIDNTENINNTIKDILFHENYFFNYTFNKINSKKHIYAVLYDDNIKSVDTWEIVKDQKIETNEDVENKIINSKSLQKYDLRDRITNKMIKNDEFIRIPNYSNQLSNNTDRSVTFDDFSSEQNCNNCFHLTNLDYTAYTKELCKANDYPYVHIDIDINYSEIWISLEPIRIPQRKKIYLLENNTPNAYYSYMKNKKPKKKSNNKRKDSEIKDKRKTYSKSYKKSTISNNGLILNMNSSKKNMNHDENDSEKTQQKTKNKLYQKIKSCKNVNIENPYVLATKGCFKSVIFFLLYNENEKKIKENEINNNRIIKDENNNRKNITNLTTYNTCVNPQHFSSLKTLNKENDEQIKLKYNTNEILKYSNLNNDINVNDFYKNKLNEWGNLMSPLLPCIVNINILFSQITSAISKPVTKNPFLKAYIDWNNIPYNNIILQPCRANFNLEIKIPSLEILLMRCLGINKITSLNFQKKTNFFYNNQVEGIDMKFSFEPIVLNVDSHMLTLLHQLYTIVIDFYNYFTKICSNKDIENEDEIFFRINSQHTNYDDSLSEYMMNDIFYSDISDVPIHINVSDHSLCDIQLFSNKNILQKKNKLYENDNLNKSFTSFGLNKATSQEERGIYENSKFEIIEKALSFNGEQNYGKDVNAYQRNASVSHKENCEPFINHTMEKNVDNKNENYNDNHNENKREDAKDAYNILDENTFNILIMNFIENTKINCQIGFDVITFQIWDSNTAYNRCSLNFVIEYFNANFSSLNECDKNLNDTNLYDPDLNYSDLKHCLNYKPTGNELFYNNDTVCINKVNEVDIANKCTDKCNDNNNDKNKYMIFKSNTPDFIAENAITQGDVYNKEEYLVYPYYFRDNHPNNINKKNIHFNNSAIKCDNNPHSILSKNKDVTHTLYNFNTCNESENNSKSLDKLYKTSFENNHNNVTFSSKLQCESANKVNKNIYDEIHLSKNGDEYSEKEKDKYLGNNDGNGERMGIFNKSKFLKNIENFNFEVKKLFKKIIFRKKNDEDMHVYERTHFGPLNGRNNKYENGNNIFLKNNCTLKDVKQNNDNKINNNIECKIEFLVYCEHFNKKENSYQTFIEPMCTEIIAIKKDLISPIHLYYYFSWININMNLNFLDNILSLCCSVIFSIITQRTRLLLGKHMSDSYYRKNNKKITQTGKSEKNDNISSKNPYIHGNLLQQPEYDDNTTEKKNISEIDDAHTSTILRNFYEEMNDDQYKDAFIITNQNILFRYNKFDVLNSVNKSLDTYIFGDFILEKLLRNYQYSCQYPGDYLEKYENVFNLDKSRGKPENLLYIKLFNYIKKKKISEMNHICKINNLLGQPIAICTIDEQDYLPSDDYTSMNIENNNPDNILNHQNYLNRHTVLLNTINTLSKIKQSNDSSTVFNNNTNIDKMKCDDNRKLKEINGKNGKKKEKGEKENKWHHRESTIIYDENKKKKLSKSYNNKKENHQIRQNTLYSEIYEQSENVTNSKHFKNNHKNFTDSFNKNTNKSLKYQWKILGNNESLDLPTYENGKVKFFLIRFRLLNYIYDIPSNILNTENVNEDVIRLVIPERVLPANINKQVEQELYNEEYLEVEKNLSLKGKYHTIYPSNYYTPKKNTTNKEYTWKPFNIPQPRNNLYIFFRTSNKISHEEKNECDFFLSSILAIKNNTDFPIYIYKSVPGNTNQNGIFKEYFHKYNNIPSPPPTYTLKIDKKIEKYIQNNINNDNYINKKISPINSVNQNDTTQEGRKKNTKQVNENYHNDTYLYMNNNKSYANKNEDNNNFIKNKTYMCGRKYIKSIFPLMKLSAIEHYISGDIKFSSLAPLKYKNQKTKKRNKEKKRIKNELKKKLVKQKIKEIYIKNIMKKIKNKKINKYQQINSNNKSQEFRRKHTILNRNIMSINDPFFNFLKRSPNLVDAHKQKLSAESLSITNLSNITLSSLPNSIFSFDTQTSNSCNYDSSLCDYDKDSYEEQVLLNEYFKKHDENKNGLDIIEISNNTDKLIPVPLYWLVAENAFIWLSIKNEKIHNTNLYAFLDEEYNADYICTKNTLDNILNYQSPFLPNVLKLFKPNLIRLKNHLLYENKMLTQSSINKNDNNNNHNCIKKSVHTGVNQNSININDKNNVNSIENYNLNYFNLKELYFTATIISVYNPNYVLNKKDAHNFYQINIDHSLMINNGLPKTMHFKYEIYHSKLKKEVKKTLNSFSSYYSTDKSIEYQSSTTIDKSFSLESINKNHNIDHPINTALSNDENTPTYDKKHGKFDNDDHEINKIQLNNTFDNLENQIDTHDNNNNKSSFNSILNDINTLNAGEKMDEKHNDETQKEKESEEKKQLAVSIAKFNENLWNENNKSDHVNYEDEMHPKSSATNITNDKKLFIKKNTNKKNVYIYKNINEENAQRNSLLQKNNFIVNIKNEIDKDIYEIKIDPGQSIRLPFIPNTANISFDGYYSNPISINYPNKKGREKIILEKSITHDIDSFFTLDCEESTIENKNELRKNNNLKCINTTINNNVLSTDINSQKCAIEQNEHKNTMLTKTNVLSPSKTSIGINPDNVQTTIDSLIDDKNILDKYVDHNKKSKYDEYQNKLTIWAIFNDFYETTKNRYQDISLKKIHHGTCILSCTFFVSACVINRLNYPIKIKSLSNNNEIVIEPYVRKLLSCEFSSYRNKVVIPLETLKEVENLMNYPLKRNIIKKKLLKKTRNSLDKTNRNIITHITDIDRNIDNCRDCNKNNSNSNNAIISENKNINNSNNRISNEITQVNDSAINEQVLDVQDSTKNQELKKNNEINFENDCGQNNIPKQTEYDKANIFIDVKKNKKQHCFFYRSNINKPLESESFKLTDLSITRLECNNRSKNIPQLKYSIYMSIAPMPFFRTTVMEILPYIVIINNTKTNLIFQEYIKNYTYFKYNTIEPGKHVEFHPQSKKKAMLKMCGIFDNGINYIIDDFLQKELYLERLEKQNKNILNVIKKNGSINSNKNTQHKKIDKKIGNNDILNLPQKLSALIDMGKYNEIGKNINSVKYDDIIRNNNKYNDINKHDNTIFNNMNNNFLPKNIFSSTDTNSEAGTISRRNTFKQNNTTVNKSQKIDDLKFLFWSESLDLTRVGIVYFRHPVISYENFKKEEMKLKMLNYLLKNNDKKNDNYLNIYNELIKYKDIPYEYSCCSMEVTTFKGCKFIRFQDIDVVPYYLINLTKYDLNLKQIGIFEHSEILHKIPKKEQKTFDEIFKNYALNFSFYNPYKETKLKISILASCTKKNKNKGGKKKNKKKTKKKTDNGINKLTGYSNDKYANLKYVKKLKNHLTNKINYLNFLSTNYVKSNENAKIINDQIFRLKLFSKQIEKLNDGNMDIVDLESSNNITLLNLKLGDTFIYVSCTKKTYNGKTILYFENYNDLINNLLNFSSIPFNNNYNHNLIKSYKFIRNKINNIYLKGKNIKLNKFPSMEYKNMSNLKNKKKENSKLRYLLNLFHKNGKNQLYKKETNTYISNTIKYLNSNKANKTLDKSQHITLNLNVFAHFIFKGLGLSISNHNLEEILYLSMEYILIVYKQISENDLLHINVGWLQIDNHTKNSDYKNVMLPIPDLHKSEKNKENKNEQDINLEYNTSISIIDKLKKNNDDNKKTIYENEKYNSKLNKSHIYYTNNSNQNFSKSYSYNILNNLYYDKENKPNKHKDDDNLYFDESRLLVSTNKNSPLYNSYKIYIPSFFYIEYNSILSITIIKKRKGNMKNFLELSEIKVKLSPMSINIDSYFIIEMLKIFDELLKILDYDLNDYNSLNVEKNIEIQDTNFDCLEYKKNIGPLEELIKNFISKDYHLYEKLANIKFKDVYKNIHDKTYDGKNLLHYNTNDNIIDIRTYLTMATQCKELEKTHTIVDGTEFKYKANSNDMLTKSVCDDKKRDSILGNDNIYSIICEDQNRKITNNIDRQSDERNNNNGYDNNSYNKNDKIHESGLNSEYKNSIVDVENDIEKGIQQNDEGKFELFENPQKNKEVENKIDNFDQTILLNEEKVNYLQTYMKNYKAVLNNRKNILKIIQNINMKNDLTNFENIFISKLEINEIKLIINIKNKSLSYEKKSEIMDSNIMNALTLLIMNIPNISDAHLYFEKEIKKNMCGSLYALMLNEIMNDYINNGMNQRFNVLGAIDFIGNPLSIYKHWKKGYQQFINDLKKSVDSCSFPLLFCILLLNIIGSFGKSILAGILEGVSRFCASWNTCFERFSRNADNFSIITNSNLFQNEILDQPSNIGEGVYYGCQSFLHILTISFFNIIYKPYIALKKRNRGFRKNEKKGKLKISITNFKLLLFAIFSSFSSLFFGFFNGILSFFTFLFIGTLNQIQTLPMKSIVRPPKMSVIKEYAKFVNYEYPLSFSSYIINEKKKKKKDLLKKNVIAIILLYKIKNNNSNTIKNFLWVNNREIGYCEKDKLLWSIYINWIIKVDILLIQLDNGEMKKCTFINPENCKEKQAEQNGDCVESNEYKNYEENKGDNQKKIKESNNDHSKKNDENSKWAFLQNLFTPKHYRQLLDFTPSYYIRILYKSAYKENSPYDRNKIINYDLNKKNDISCKIKKTFKKNKYEKYFEEAFKKEHMLYEENSEINERDNNMENGEKYTKYKQNNNGNAKKSSSNKNNYYFKQTSSSDDNDNKRDITFTLQTEAIQNEKNKNKNEKNKNKNKKNKDIYQHNQEKHKIEHKKPQKNQLKKRKKQKYLYISKLVKCESKEVALHAFSLLLSFIKHKSPYYLNPRH
ncbi:hypothetical protein YYC_00360 [Plasmodium yoelii 17X]|uniref:Chorein N-terminal domain-containing protein n=1 Tax=Plasmodium yoelii 17X TaxID=1323249 RepID=V7PVJ1_PLAYE|nr:hypothetical protein YYC_00360 [Plasmodium yoelii 17X]